MTTATLYTGPIGIHVDHAKKYVSFSIMQRGPSMTRVSDSVMANIAKWALRTAEGFEGYRIDKTVLMPFFNCDDSEKSEASKKSKRRNSG